MPEPLLSARGAPVAAAGALAALAAMAGLTAARADSILAREAMQGQETMATRDPATFRFGAPGKAAESAFACGCIVARPARIRQRHSARSPFA